MGARRPQRIVPDANLDSTIAVTRGVVGQASAIPRTPKVDTSLLDGLASLSAGLKAFTVMKQGEVKAAREQATDEVFSEIQGLSVEELEKRMFSEEGKTILAGMGLGRQRLWQEFAGAKYAEGKAAPLYAADFKARMLDVNDNTVNIEKDVIAEGMKSLKFEDKHGATFRRAAFAAMSSKLRAQTDSLQRQRGVAIQEAGKVQIEAEASREILRYSTNTKLDDAANFKQTMDVLAKIEDENTGTTGESIDTAVMNAVSTSVGSATSNLTEDMELRPFKRQVTFARSYFRSKGDKVYLAHEQELNDLEAKIDNAEETQQRTADANKDRDDREQTGDMMEKMSRWFVGLTEDTRATLSDKDTSTLFIQFRESLENDGDKAFLDGKFVQFKGFIDASVRSEPKNPKIKAAGDAAHNQFVQNVWRGEYEDVNGGIDAALSLADEFEMGQEAFKSMVLAVRTHNAQSSSVTTRVSRFLGSAAAPTIAQGVFDLQDELSQAIAGKDYDSWYKDEQDVEGGASTRLKSIFDAAPVGISGYLTQSMTTSVGTKISKGMTEQQAFDETLAEMPNMLAEAIALYKIDVGFDGLTEDLTNIAKERTVIEETIIKAKQSGRGVAALYADGTLNGIPRSGLDLEVFQALDPNLTLSTEGAEARNKEWKDVAEGYRFMAEGLDASRAAFIDFRSKRGLKATAPRVPEGISDTAKYGAYHNIGKGGAGLVYHVPPGASSGAASVTATRAYLGSRAMGVDPFTVNELKQTKIRNIFTPTWNPDVGDKRGIGLNQTEFDSSFVYDYTATLYVRNMDDLKLMMSDGRAAEYIAITREHFPDREDSKLSDGEAMNLFRQQQRKNLILFGLTSNKEAK